MNNECICITAMARYRCRYAIPGTTNGCDLIATTKNETMSDSKKHLGKSQNKQERSKRFWLKLAKNERSHAQDNMNKARREGNEYSTNVYSVRMKALDHYIKLLQAKEA